MTGDSPKFVYVAGCDGTGKSTQAKLLLDRMRAEGVRVRHLWLRYPFFLSVPLLAYARLRGYSWRERVEQWEYGYWDFRKSGLLRRLFPWALLLDAALASVVRVYLPIFLGYTIVCERFTLDMLVDLSVACKDDLMYRHVPGRLFQKLLPRSSATVILDLEADAIRARRPSLRFDQRLEARLAVYRELARALGYPLISSGPPRDEVFQHVLREVG